MGAATALQPTTPPTGPLRPAAKAPTVAPKAAPGIDTSELDTDQAELDAKLKGIGQGVDALTPPKLDDMPKMPEPQGTSPVQVWGSLAMGLAAIGSLMTRQPLTTALNSAANVMNAYKKGDQETADAEFARWKVASENAIKLHNFEMEQYKAALSKASVDEKAAMAEFTAKANAFGHKTAAELGSQRNAIEAKKLVMDGERLGMQMQEAYPKVVAAKAAKDAMDELQRSPEFKAADSMKRLSMTADVMNKADPKQAAAANLMTDDTLRTMAEQAWAGDTSVYQGMGYGATGAANRLRLRNMVTTIGEEQGKKPVEIGRQLAAANASFMGQKAEARTIGTRAGAGEYSATEAEIFAKQAIAASKALPRGQWKISNQFIQYGQIETSNPALRRLLVATDALANARARAISPSGAPHIMDQVEGRKLLSAALSEGDYEAVADQMVMETQGVMQAGQQLRSEQGGGAALDSDATTGGGAAPKVIDFNSLKKH